MNTIRPAITVIAMLVLLVGCGRLPGTITGDIEGDEVGSIRSAIFAMFEFDDTNEESIIVMASTAPDACEHLTARYEFFYDISAPNATVNDKKNGVADLADYINKNGLVGHWTFMALGIADRRVDFRDQNRISVDPDAGVGSDRMIFAAEEQRRAPYFDQTDGYFAGSNYYEADQGAGWWSADPDNRYVEVEGTARLRDEHGDRAGSLEYELYALPCQSFGNVFADLLNR